MSFADELRANTKTKEQLAREKAETERFALQRRMDEWHRQIKQQAMEAAQQGKTHCLCEIGCFDSRAEAKELTNRLIEILRQDGFKNLSYTVRRYAGHRTIQNSFINVNW